MSPTTDIYGWYYSKSLFRCDKQILYNKISLSIGIKFCHTVVTLKQDYDKCTQDNMSARERPHHQDTWLNLAVAGSHIGWVQMYAVKEKKWDKCTITEIKTTNKLWFSFHTKLKFQLKIWTATSSKWYWFLHQMWRRLIDKILIQLNQLLQLLHNISNPGKGAH